MNGLGKAVKWYMLSVTLLCGLAFAAGVLAVKMEQDATHSKLKHSAVTLKMEDGRTVICNWTENGSMILETTCQYKVRWMP